MVMFDTLFGIWGIFFVLVGLLTPILLPLIPATIGYGHILARFHLWLAAKLHGRMLWIVDEHDRLVLKRMKYDAETENEVVKLDGERREFEDPDLSISHWMGVDMALGDGKQGVIFDPRHAALGARKLDAREQDEAAVPADPTTAKSHNIAYWYKGVVSFDRDKFELPRLSYVRQMFGGCERSIHPKIVKEFYRKSREPYKEDGSMLRLLIPIAALLIPFLSLWLIGDWMGSGESASGSGGGAGGGDSGENGTDVDLGWLLLLTLPALPWRRWLASAWAIIKPILAVSIGLGSIIALYWAGFTYAGIGPTIGATIAFVGGLAIFGLILLIAAASKIVGGGVSSLLFQLAFMAYHRPVFVWTPEEYKLVDWRRVSSDQRSDYPPAWYRQYGRLMGFTFEPNPRCWSENIPNSDLKILAGTELDKDLARDGGSDIAVDIRDENIPAGYTGTDALRRAVDLQSGVSYSGYIPTEPSDEKYYVKFGVAMERLREAATGEKSLRGLLAAKEEYGGADSKASETYWLAATVGLALISFVAGIGIWIL